MNTLLNFIDTGFIITLGILILVSGAIMLYSYRRLNLLENSVIEHGKILQNFIMNYNNQMIKNSYINNINDSQYSVINNNSNNSNEICQEIDQSDENEENDETNIKKIDLENKISVSDNEDNISDEDSSDEDSSDEDEDSSDEDEDKQEDEDEEEDEDEDKYKKIIKK